MDDTFLLFSSSEDVKKFDKYINSRHKSMSFTHEVENDNKLPFLDILVTRENSFTTNMYRKPTLLVYIQIFTVFYPKSIKVD